MDFDEARVAGLGVFLDSHVDGRGELRRRIRELGTDLHHDQETDRSLTAVGQRDDPRPDRERTRALFVRFAQRARTRHEARPERPDPEYERCATNWSSRISIWCAFSRSSSPIAARRSTT